MLAILLCLIPPSPVTEQIRPTHDVATLSEEGAGKHVGKEAGFKVRLTSEDDTHNGWRLWEIDMGDSYATLWLPKDIEAEDEMTVEGTLVILRHQPAQGFEGFTEYRLYGREEK